VIVEQVVQASSVKDLAGYPGGNFLHSGQLAGEIGGLIDQAAIIISQNCESASTPQGAALHPVNQYSTVSRGTVKKIQGCGSRVLSAVVAGSLILLEGSQLAFTHIPPVFSDIIHHTSIFLLDLFEVYLGDKGY
jgi:hypothetical protein